MVTLEAVKSAGDLLLVIFFTLVLLVSILLTIRLRFIQIRMLPDMLKLLFSGMFGKKRQEKNAPASSIPSYKALFTAMSTTIGIGNIVGPAVAIRLGGPGALLYFMIALFFGSATTFVEVTFALWYRKKFPDGTYSGGPMMYIQKVIGSLAASFYAITGALLLVVWSSSQSNTLSDIISNYNIPHSLTGAIITLVVLFYLFSGIEKIGDLAAKIVPIMFILYCTACLWVIFMNITALPGVFKLILTSALYPSAVTGAAAGYSIQQLLRWGLAKGTHVGEAGIGTATIPHSQSTVTNPTEQGVISMVSAYSVGILCLLSGLVSLVTGSWQDTSIPLGINMLSLPFAQYIPFSAIVLSCSSFLFALGTILGNAYNGGQCFSYITKHRWVHCYYVFAAIFVFLGSIVDVQIVWDFCDYFIIPVALLNLIAVVSLSFKEANRLKTN